MPDGAGLNEALRHVGALISSWIVRVSLLPRRACQWAL
ncbi:hypothetical protein BN2537_16853 [Streptomyces venezuelae]|nr:hypothetical protein BN2537_16853 [Streptomyces venezuelae]